MFSSLVWYRHQIIDTCMLLKLMLDHYGDRSRAQLKISLSHTTITGLINHGRRSVLRLDV